MAILPLGTGCGRKAVQVPVAVSTQNENSFMDLAAGGALRIVLPIYHSGAYKPLQGPVEQNGNTMTLSAADLEGYELVHYAIEGRPDGRVRLQFKTAEITRNGVSEDAGSAPALPFALPGKRQHIRLIYLVRRSESDHNMAIAAAKNMDALNAFTEQLKRNPEVCNQNSGVFCSWVPAGVAVRPE